MTLAYKQPFPKTKYDLCVYYIFRTFKKDDVHTHYTIETIRKRVTELVFQQSE